MKKEIIDIPEVNLSDVKEFWVLGSQYKDGILGEYNLKIDVKALYSEGPWYMPIIGEIDLTGFPAPRDGGDPVVLTGVEIPDKDEIIIAFLSEGSPRSATLTKRSSVVFRGEGFNIYKENDVWMWEIVAM